MANAVQPERLRAECPNCKHVAWFVLALSDRTDGAPGGSWRCANCGYRANVSELAPLPE